MKNKVKKLLGMDQKAPREMKEIQAEYQKTAFNAGQTQYVIKANQLELDRLNDRLMALNLEGEQRNKLDSETAKAKAEAATVAEKKA